MPEPILRVGHLAVDYHVGAGAFLAVRDASFDLHAGRVVGIVGETGCGKSTLARAIPRILPEPPAKIPTGSVVFQGVDLVRVPRPKLPRVRGTSIGMIFQEPINSLNPAYRVGDQLVEAVRSRRLRERGLIPQFHAPRGYDYSRHTQVDTGKALTHAYLPSAPEGSGSRPGLGLGRGRAPRTPTDDELSELALAYLRHVRINDPETILGLYPHELSGGMRQRIMIAMALSEKPTLLIADEPTSALDITIQAQVLTLMKELQEEVRTSILFISHDLGVIAEMADEVGVMYAGNLVEFGPIEDVFEHPGHPYTKALLHAVPDRYKTDGPLPSLTGTVPNLSRPPPGCAFHPRCVLARPECSQDPAPAMRTAGGAPPGSSHRAACHFTEEVSRVP